VPVVGSRAQSADDWCCSARLQFSMITLASMRSRWARRRKIDLAELVNESWILATPGSGPHTIVSEAFRARGLSTPNISLMTLSVLLRANMVASGQFITTFPNSVVRLHADRLALKVLPVDWAPTQTRCGDASIQDDSRRARRILFRAEHALPGGSPLARLSDHQSPGSCDPRNGNRCAAPCYPHAVVGGTAGGPLPSGRWLRHSLRPALSR
jgi:DNA-binding transcriptional LysR family regulator